jgi:serine/threonine protein kinase
MGMVFMAEQTRPVQRKVALKLIKSGMDSRQVVARFEQERQALALMDHPNIARVLDAGTTDAGRPYFVMELVKGVPITRYCDEHRLTPRQRLELFVPVCQAVQHAHQKGIIHRDLKPSNVLVCLYDGQPVPKVIDFGIAKATGPKLTEGTLCTEFGTLCRHAGVHVAGTGTRVGSADRPGGAHPARSSRQGRLRGLRPRRPNACLRRCGGHRAGLGRADWSGSPYAAGTPQRGCVGRVQPRRPPARLRRFF